MLYIAAGAWLAFGVTGFRIDGQVMTGGPSNPLLKQASIGGSWLTNGPLGRWACVAAAIAIVAALATPLLARRGAHVTRVRHEFDWRSPAPFCRPVLRCSRS